MPPVDVSNIPVDRVHTAGRNELGPDGLPPRGIEDFMTAGGPNIINLLKIPGEQQVMLKVTVAEVSRAAARSIGLNFSVNTKSGYVVAGNTTAIPMPTSVLSSACRRPKASMESARPSERTV
jgi:Flp pilus assembly secretin CpaC